MLNTNALAALLTLRRNHDFAPTEWEMDEYAEASRGARSPGDTVGVRGYDEDRRVTISLDNNTFFNGTGAPTERLPRGWTREDVERAGKCDRCGTHIEAGAVLVFCSAAESWWACSVGCAERLTPKKTRRGRQQED